MSDGGTGALLVTTAYNAAGYATTLTRASDGTVYGTVQAMDAWGHATQVHEANGVTITRGYSQVTGLAQNLTAAKGDITVAQYTYDFDHFGNLAERDDVLAGSTETEHYDDLNRLIKSVLNLAGGGGGTTTYTYDDSGNLKSRSDRAPTAMARAARGHKTTGDRPRFFPMATLMLENGADIRFIQAMLGHACIENTTIYAQVSIRALKEVYARTHPARHLPHRERGQEDDADARDMSTEAELLAELDAEAGEEKQ